MIFFGSTPFTIGFFLLYYIVGNYPIKGLSITGPFRDPFKKCTDP